MAITAELPNDLEGHLEREWPDLPRRALEPTETDALPVRNNACLDYDGEDPAADVEAGRTLADR
jgi:hypothetical protein